MKLYTCPWCNELATSRERQERHIIAMHPDKPQEFVELLGPGKAPKEASMADESHGCATCESNKVRLEIAGKELATAQGRVAALESALSQSHRDLEAAQKADMPPLSKVLRHCESGDCATHAGELDKLKASIVNQAYASIPRDILEREASKAGLLPDRIVIK